MPSFPLSWIIFEQQYHLSPDWVDIVEQSGLYFDGSWKGKNMVLMCICRQLTVKAEVTWYMGF